MKVGQIFIALTTLAACPVVCAQNMAEYSTLATKPTTAPNAIAATSQALARKAGSLSTDVPTRKDSASAVSVLGHRQPVPGPTPPAVFILSNGERLESNGYLLTINSLRVQQAETQRTIPLNAINLDATIAANRERGIDLKIPKNKSEVMLRF